MRCEMSDMMWCVMTVMWCVMWCVIWCYVMWCYALWCDAMGRDVMRCDGTGCDVMRWDGMWCDAMGRDVMWCDGMYCDVIERCDNVQIQPATQCSCRTGCKRTHQLDSCCCHVIPRNLSRGNKTMFEKSLFPCFWSPLSSRFTNSLTWLYNQEFFLATRLSKMLLSKTYRSCSLIESKKELWSKLEESIVFWLFRALGQGAFGEVFKGCLINMPEEPLNLPVAAKVSVLIIIRHLTVLFVFYSYAMYLNIPT